MTIIKPNSPSYGWGISGIPEDMSPVFVNAISALQNKLARQIMMWLEEEGKEISYQDLKDLVGVSPAVLNPLLDRLINAKLVVMKSKPDHNYFSLSKLGKYVMDVEGKMDELEEKENFGKVPEW